MFPPPAFSPLIGPEEVLSDGKLIHVVEFGVLIVQLHILEAADSVSVNVRILNRRIHRFLWLLSLLLRFVGRPVSAPSLCSIRLCRRLGWLRSLLWSSVAPGISPGLPSIILLAFGKSHESLELPSAVATLLECAAVLLCCSAHHQRCGPACESAWT